MSFVKLAVVALVLATLPSTAAADCPVSPRLRIFAAENGSAFVRVVARDGGSTDASLYRIFNSEERLVWSASLPVVPHAVWVDGGARWVVTRGEYCKGGGKDQEHAVNVYDEQGALIRELRRSELVSDDDYARRVSIVEAHTPWSASAGIRIEPHGDELRLILPWGESRVLVAGQ